MKKIRILKDDVVVQEYLANGNYVDVESNGDIKIYDENNKVIGWFDSVYNFDIQEIEPERNVKIQIDFSDLAKTLNGLVDVSRKKDNHTKTNDKIIYLYDTVYRFDVDDLIEQFEYAESENYNISIPVKKEKKPWGCIIRRSFWDDGKLVNVRYGWSVCHSDDKFNKKIAKEIAMKRLNNPINNRIMNGFRGNETLNGDVDGEIENAIKTHGENVFGYIVPQKIVNAIADDYLSFINTK